MNCTGAGQTVEVYISNDMISECMNSSKQQIITILSYSYGVVQQVQKCSDVEYDVCRVWMCWQGKYCLLILCVFAEMLHCQLGLQCLSVYQFAALM